MSGSSLDCSEQAGDLLGWGGWLFKSSCRTTLYIQINGKLLDFPWGNGSHFGSRKKAQNLESLTHNNSPWPGGSVGWSIIPCPGRLQVCFLVRAHAWVSVLIPGWGEYEDNKLMFLSHIKVSLSVCLPPFLSLSKSNKKNSSGEDLKNDNYSSIPMKVFLWNHMNEKCLWWQISKSRLHTSPGLCSVSQYEGTPGVVFMTCRYLKRPMWRCSLHNVAH